MLTFTFSLLDSLFTHHLSNLANFYKLSPTMIPLRSAHAQTQNTERVHGINPGALSVERVFNLSLSSLSHPLHRPPTPLNDKGGPCGGVWDQGATFYICWIMLGSKDAAKKTLSTHAFRGLQEHGFSRRSRRWCCIASVHQHYTRCISCTALASQVVWPPKNVHTGNAKHERKRVGKKNAEEFSRTDGVGLKF